ncbi:MAG: hypothetical protein Q9M15_04385 [Mariprofundaceae bacterium]|nr:hypothetical protein [Mariprofundaceae bacterium]
MWKYLVGMMVIFLADVGLVGAAPTIIEFTQTGCQFIEPENQDYGYKPKNSSDCKHINASTQEKRLAVSQVRRLQAGDYIFRVHNRDVPYDLGFWLRGQGFRRLTLPSVSGGGMGQGESKDYSIHLTAGSYYYSCPLNPTPSYTLIVK